EYQSAIEVFAKQGLIELSLVMGTYALIAVAVNSFDSELPANRTEPVLPVYPDRGGSCHGGRTGPTRSKNWWSTGAPSSIGVARRI
ncbi:MAG: hypothetical protein O6914_03910, partial [Chloroflexi bacterium]|nr:hypothetical protein [Chloroflexota bacterium]